MKFTSIRCFFLKFFIYNFMISFNDCFFPNRYMDDVVSKIDETLKINLGEISKTLTHEEILKRGLLKSVVFYFYQQPNGSAKMNLSKINNEYLELKNIYQDYYNQKVCSIELESIMSRTLFQNVDIVDLDPKTRKMPYAHFDSETFQGSNQRVINFNKMIYESIDKKDYDTSRKLIGQVLHTIQDFYSHSNWAEMGYKNQINENIGTDKFFSEPIAAKDEKACISNCELIEIKCNKFATRLSSLVKKIGYKIYECPLRYYKCYKNIALLDKLVSGYSVSQKLPDGTPIEKPLDKGKCSHGGILDSSAFVEAKGGINKDSGFYLFSPHADLHLNAANLAINHTEFYFNQLRDKIGDTKFSELLGLKIKSSILDKFKHLFKMC